MNLVILELAKENSYASQRAETKLLSLLPLVKILDYIAIHNRGCTSREKH